MWQQYGQLYGVALEALLLGAGLSDKYKRNLELQKRKAENLAIEVQDLNQGLELKVEEKTRNIRSMMTHMSQGMFLLLGEELSCHREFSKVLPSIVGKKDLEGQDLNYVLLGILDISDDEKDRIKTSLKSCIDEDEFTFTSEASISNKLRSVLNVNNDLLNHVDILLQVDLFF